MRCQSDGHRARTSAPELRTHTAGDVRQLWRRHPARAGAPYPLVISARSSLHCHGAYAASPHSASLSVTTLEDFWMKTLDPRGEEGRGGEG